MLIRMFDQDLVQAHRCFWPESMTHSVPAHLARRYADAAACAHAFDRLETLPACPVSDASLIKEGLGSLEAWLDLREREAPDEAVRLVTYAFDHQLRLLEAAAIGLANDPAWFAQAHADRHEGYGSLMDMFEAFEARDFIEFLIRGTSTRPLWTARIGTSFRDRVEAVDGALRSALRGRRSKAFWADGSFWWRSP